MAATAGVESWDDDLELQGDLFTHSVSTVQTSMSSRLSIHSESNAGDEDWQVLLEPNDEISTMNAISSAKQVGIPIPQNVSSSALLGGTIKRLGKTKPQHIIEDDWGDDLELPVATSEALTLKPKPSPVAAQVPTTPGEIDDDFEEWAEGSLGIRFAGTRRETKDRSCSVSLMSPSMNSCMTAESEEDDMTGLVLPTGPVDFAAALQKKKDAEPEQPEQPETAAETRADACRTVPEPAEAAKDDFFADIEIGAGDVFDTKKLTLNRNVKQKPAKMTVPPLRTATTLTFTDKPTTTRIPRPVNASKASRLEPVFEAGATASSKGPRRPEPTTTSAQLLRSKRSLPQLRNQPPPASKVPPVPFLPAGIANAQSRNINARPHFSVHHNVRRDSDPHRPQSPPPRPFSRLSTAFVPDTPTRSRRADVAPAALAREAAAKKTVTRPTRRRNFGDGTELEVFDDLPTSATKESKFIKQPAGRGLPKAMRPSSSKSNAPLSLPERMMTPFQQNTPTMPPKNTKENTPRFARDTAASRIAREQRLGNTSTTSNMSAVLPTRPRGEGPLMPVSTNWKAQVAARSPHTSPSANRGKKGTGQKPSLIKPMGINVARTEKGMTYNPVLQRWEGNENALHSFDSVSHPSPNIPSLPTPTIRSSAPALTLIHPIPQLQKYHEPPELLKSPSPSPPRPALITNFGVGAASHGVQVNGGMVFDPRRMCWLKLGPRDRDSLSPAGSAASVAEDDDDDPFAGIDDLPDERKARPSSVGGASGAGGAAKSGHLRGASEPVGSAGGGGGNDALAGAVHEEFDLGPDFIRRQREEEALWRKMVGAWFRDGGQKRKGEGERWRWAIRELVVKVE